MINPKNDVIINHNVSANGFLRFVAVFLGYLGGFGGRMIDTHCHIIFGLDDGSDSIETTLEMAHIAVSAGITDIIATPHCVPGSFDNYAGDDLDRAFKNIRTLVSDATDSRLNIHRGMEVYAASSTIDLLEKGLLVYMSRSNYMLVECAFDEDPGFLRDTLRSMIRRGVRPIIAHPERYYFAHDSIRPLMDMVDMGCALQLDTASITGDFGSSCRRTAIELLDSGAVQLAASDAHDAFSRVPDMRDAAKFVAFNYSSNYADLLLEINPARVLENRSMLFRGQNSSGRQSPSANRFMTDEEYWGI